MQHPILCAGILLRKGWSAARIFIVDTADNKEEMRSEASRKAGQRTTEKKMDAMVADIEKMAWQIDRTRLSRRM